MRYAVLGPLTVSDGSREIVIAGRKERVVLVDLLLHAGRAVPREQLLDDVWDGARPSRASDALNVFVSHLRAALGRDAIRTSRGAYALAVDPEQIDAHRFERLAREGRDALDGGRPDAAAELLREALALWRGPAFGELAGLAFAAPAAARLEALRLGAEEDRIDAELELGDPARVAVELEALVVEHPLRERLRGQLMRALYAAGRQADALEAYRQARSVLVEEQGLEPSPALRQLEQAILRQDPALAAPSPAVPEPEAPPAAVGGRKLVTVACVEPVLERSLDVEAASAALTELTAVAVAVFGEHGAEVDRLGNGRIVAWFGVPSVREDDALRALQAAAAAVAAAGVRVGVASGEALVGGGARPVGSVALEAEELARGAAAGAVVLSPLTERLTRGEAAVEALEGGPAYGLVSLEPAERGPETPFVGRDHELARLEEAFAGVVRRGACALVTVFGAAGLGKSRLAAELPSRLPGARVLSVRCMPRGERRTFGPLGQIVAALGGRCALTGLLAGVPQGEIVAERLAAAIDGTSLAPAAETAWATAQLLSTLAVERPVALVVDDLHWAEPIFLDLLDSLVDHLRSRPVLVVCFARPELLDDRPGWGGGQPSSTTLPLEPLTTTEAEELVSSRDDRVPAADRARVIETAEGNPLFVEQLLASLAYEGSLATPPTIQALLSARLDRLGEVERSVVQTASVVGDEFAFSVVGPLVGEDVDLERELRALVRKDLMRPSKTARVGEYRFCHHLIREVAYSTLPRTTRADLHERVAEVLADDEDADAVVGLHLERAYRNRVEVGQSAARLEQLAVRASERLRSAAMRAELKVDKVTAFDLYERAARLRPPLSREQALLHVRATRMGVRAIAAAEAHVMLADAVRVAETTGDEALKAYVVGLTAERMLWTDPSYSIEEFARQAAAASRKLASDEPALAAQALRQHGTALYLRGRAADAERAMREATRLAREHDPIVWELASRERLVHLVWGPRHVTAVRRACERVLQRIPGGPLPTLRLTGAVRRAVSICAAMAGSFDEARRLAEDALAIAEQLDVRSVRTLNMEALGIAAYLAGDLETAEEAGRSSVEMVSTASAQFWLADAAAFHARLLCLLGRFDEADEVVARTATVAERNLGAVVRAESVRALLALERGDWDEAVERARRAAEIGAGTDVIDCLGESNEDLATVLEAVGEREQARAALRRAYGVYARKGHIAAVAVRERLGTQRGALRSGARKS